MLKTKAPDAIRTAIFDVGMVLLRFDFEIAVRAIQNQCAVRDGEMVPLLWGSGLVDAYDRGQIGTAEFVEKASRLIGFRGAPAALVKAWCDIFTPNPPMIERVRRWKERGISLYLLSNTCESHIEFFTSKYAVFSMFDGGVYSCREGAMKPERAIYERLIQRYHVDPPTAVFLDDRIENVTGGLDLGLRAIHYQNEEDLTRELSKMGLE